MYERYKTTLAGRAAGPPCTSPSAAAYSTTAQRAAASMQPLPTMEHPIDVSNPSSSSSPPAICVTWWHEFILPCAAFFIELMPPAVAVHFSRGSPSPAAQRELPSISPMRMSVDLRRKLGRGAKYNLRLLIRGDLQTGKTQLWRRLQGLPFSAEVPTTRTLGAVHLDWTCERSADVVKVEAWDVVDADLTRAARNSKEDGLTLAHIKPANGSMSPRSSAALDVWKGAHACVCTFDPRKRWTFAYALRLLQEAPPTLPFLLLANFADVLEAPTPGGAGGGGAAGGASAGCGGTPAGGADATHAMAWSEVEQAAKDESARSGRSVVCVRGSVYDTRGLAAVHAFIQVPYYELVRSAMAEAREEAEASLYRAEAHVRAVASGEPFQDALDTGGEAGGTPASPEPSASMVMGALPPTTPPSRGLKFGISSNATPTPKLAPPPSCASTPAGTPSAHQPTPAGGGGVGGAAVLSMDAIDDSFFDGLDAPPAPEHRKSAGASMAGISIAPPPATSPSRQPVPTSQREDVMLPVEDDDDDERDEGDLLGLLEDPDEA